MIAVFVRPATPGRAKTRLIPALGPQGAARLYRAMARDVIDAACALDGHSVELWVAGAIADPALDFAPPTLSRTAQPEGELGARMHAALAAGIARTGQCLVLGSDAPGLGSPELGQAFARLNDAEVVLGPSADGGYMLIAARRCHPRMFDGVRMSTRHALADTRRACLAQGLSVALTPPWFDLDTPADLGTLRALLSLAPGLAPHTARVLALGQAPGLLTTSPRPR